MHHMERSFIQLLETRINAQNNTTPEIQEQIEVDSEILSGEIIHGVDQLNTAMDVATISLTFPL